MRVKSDNRRQSILNVATTVFREFGYERASMAEISARVGGSKATLYNYFKSKEDLFAAVMMEAMETQGEEVIALLDITTGDLRSVLVQFGHAYLNLVTAAEALAITRTAVAEGTHCSLGTMLYERGPRRGLQEITSYIRKLQARGDINSTSPAIAAAHLKGLLETGLLEPLLYGALPEFDREEAVRAAVDTFLRAYGTFQSA